MENTINGHMIFCEVHFYFSVFVNTQNHRIWPTENPVTIPLRSPKAWFLLTASFTVGLLSFKKMGLAGPILVTVMVV